MRLSVSLAASLSLAGAAAAWAQPQLTKPPPSFKAGVNLVRLDVRVTDGDGRPVRDIRQDELEVIQDGERRPIVFFRHVEEPTGSYADVVNQTVAGEVSTNQGAARGHLYVFVFDQPHITSGNEQRVRIAAQRFLETRVRPGDRVAAYALGGPGPQIGFTADARRVSAELAKIRGMAERFEGGPLASMRVDEAYRIARGDAAILERVSERLSIQLAATDVRRGNSNVESSRSESMVIKEDAAAIVERSDTEARRVLALLSDVIGQLRPVEGRKTVLLISEGFYADNVTREIEDVAAAAARSYSVIYAFDLNRRNGDLTESQPGSTDVASGILARLNALGSLAGETGGLLVTDAGMHADQAFAALGDQSEDYYLVGFEPRDVKPKNPAAYRRVKVNVRRDGVVANTRTGFSLADPSATLNRREAIDRALSAPFPQQALPVRYTTYVLRGTSAGLQRVILSLAADLPVVSARQSQPADVVFVVRAAKDGRIAASGTDVIALPAHHDTDATVGTGTFRIQFELPADDYMMRAVVREPGGLVGSADRRFTVRALDGPALSAGDLVISAQRGELPVRPLAYTGEALSGVVELYGRSTEQLERARVIFDVVAVGEQVPLVVGVADLEPPREVGAAAARTAHVDVPLESIPAGAYLARAKVMVGADTVGEVVREVEIRSGRRPADAAAAQSEAFDPVEILRGALGRQYAATLAGGGAGSPSSRDGLRGLERLAARDYPAAVSAFQSALTAAEPKSLSASTAFLLGWAFHAAGDDRQAISAWRRAAYEDPTLIPAHLALADVYEQLAQPALAAQALRAGLTALPDARELIDRLSRIERR
jgi:VWFA-related protein